MKNLICSASFIIIAGLASTSVIPSGKPVLTAEFVEEVKSKASTWEPLAHEDNPFKDLSEEELAKKLGLLG